MNYPPPPRRYDITGHVHFCTFSTYRSIPLLTNVEWRTNLAKWIRISLDKHHMALWAYVFMPEHVHLLVKPRLEDYSISLFLQDMKEGFSRELIEYLKKLNSPLLDKLYVRERPGKWCHRTWQEGGGHDFNVYTQEKAMEKAEYCHNNPVRRGLVRHPGQWRWSSYRWLVLGERVDAPLRMDEWDWSLLDEEEL